MSDVELGCRSPLVLAKLGYDLRSSYRETLEGPMPDRIRELCDQLAGYASFTDVSDDEDADDRLG